VLQRAGVYHSAAACAFAEMLTTMVAERR